MTIIKHLVLIFEGLFFLYFVTINVTYLTLNVMSFISIRKSLLNKKANYWVERKEETTTPITIIAPAYNEELTIVESVKSMLHLEYEKYEVIVVCDGPKDKTLENLIKNFDLVEVENNIRTILRSKKIEKVYLSKKETNLKVILKENGGKADALNCGINASKYPLFCAIDADSLLNKDSLTKLSEAFEKSGTVAVGGIVRIANGCSIKDGVVQEIKTPKTWIEKIQIVEYLRAFYLGRMGWKPLDSILIISGAFGLFLKKAVIQAGGYTVTTVGEDMDLILKLRQQGIKTKTESDISFVPDAVCWTQCPDDYKTLKNQRTRWQKGLLECLWEYKSLMFNFKGGKMSFLAFPFFLFIEGLGPVIEMIGYISLIIFWSLGLVKFEVILYFYLMAVGFGLLLSIGSIYTEEVYFNHYKTKEVLNLMWASVVENIWFRYLHLYWRVKGAWQFIMKKGTWGEMKRKSFTT